jgi:hypothetical protein
MHGPLRCPGLLIKEVTMAIYKSPRKLAAAVAAEVAGAAPGAALAPIALPSFSFSPNEGLAEMIVEAWDNRAYRDQLLDRAGNPPAPTAQAIQLATASVNARGFNLKRAVVISEAEHDNTYTSLDDDEVVFVLPEPSRLGTPFGPRDALLKTARLLMACTPNGI